MKSKSLLITTFISGYVIMALELLGARMLAPYFGNSIYVWGSLIGIIMCALAIGYFLGGKLIDKLNDEKVIHYIIFFTEIWLIGLLISFNTITKLFFSWGEITGPLIISIILFLPPMILLGGIAPSIIKLLTKEKKEGEVAGKVYAMSTMGSLFGTFITLFYMIPELGVNLALKTNMVLLLFPLFLNFKKNKKKSLVIILLIASFFIIENVEAETLFQKNSVYNLVSVTNESGILELTLNKIGAVQSSKRKNLYDESNYNTYLIVGPILSKGKEILSLGLGGGTTINVYNDAFQNLNLEIVEIDPVVVDVAKKYFDYSKENVKTIIGDARNYLLKTNKTYDIIINDVYGGGIYVPFHLVTKEFFKIEYEHLTKEGVLLMNVIDGGCWENYMLLDSITNTLMQVFPSIYQVRVSDENGFYKGNHILIATKEKIELEEIKEKLNNYQDEKLNELLNKIINELKPANPITKTVFYDNKNNLESITHQSINC